MRWHLALTAVALSAVAGPAARVALAVAPAPVVAPAPAAPAPAPVNLLRWAPTIVAVSSSVANTAYLPEHLVDGDLKTAWNSRTGEQGAWIDVRVPATASVTAIRMTVGFTSSSKAGDYFTQNQRIRKVRIARAGVVLGEYVLDLDVRGLQEIPIGTAGGDFRIEVRELVPGSKPAWRETIVSELEVWGTLPAATAPVASKPVVRIGGLDALPAPSFATCQKLLFPAARGGRVGPEPEDDFITDWASLGVGRDLAVCRVEHAGTTSSTVTTELVAVQVGARTALGPRVTVTFDRTAPGTQRLDVDHDGDVAMTRLPLTTAEAAVLVDVSTTTNGPMLHGESTDSSLYRIGSAGLVTLVAFKSSLGQGEADSADKCALRRITPRARMPDLVVTCTHTVGRWHGEDPRGNGTFSDDDTTQTFHWTGTAYEE